MAAKLAVLVAMVIAAVVADDSLKTEDAHLPDDDQSKGHHAELNFRIKPEEKGDEHIKDHLPEESKEGKNIHGSLSLMQPNGVLRVVKFGADHYGFHPEDYDKEGYNKYDDDDDKYDRKKGDHKTDYPHEYHQHLELISYPPGYQ